MTHGPGWRISPLQSVTTHNPSVREACLQLLIEEMWRWPSCATRAAASICSDDAGDALTDICPQKLADRLTASGWAVTQAATDL